MDSYGNIAVVRDANQVVTALKTHDSAYVYAGLSETERILKLQFLAGLANLKGINVENKFSICFDLSKMYYNPRYSYERRELHSYLKSVSKSRCCVVYGAGNGVFAIYLSDLYESVISYDINADACKYARFNCDLNGVKNITVLDRLNSAATAISDVVVMIPTYDYACNPCFEFNKNLILYVLLHEAEKNQFVSACKSNYPACEITLKPVRAYAKNLNVLRATITKPHYA